MRGFWRKSFFKDINQLRESSFFLYDLIIFLRIVSPPLIWLSPLLVTVAAFSFDLVDYEIFRICSAKKTGQKYNYWGLVKVNYDLYHVMDKILDFYWYFFALLFSIKFKIFFFLLFLFLWRFLGVVIFLVNNNRRLFLIFGNYFENVFVFYLFASRVRAWNYLLEGKYFYFSLIFLFILKIIQEYYIHLSGYSTTYRYLISQKFKRIFNQFH